MKIILFETLNNQLVQLTESFISIRTFVSKKKEVIIGLTHPLNINVITNSNINLATKTSNYRKTKKLVKDFFTNYRNKISQMFVNYFNCDNTSPDLPVAVKFYSNIL